MMTLEDKGSDIPPSLIQSFENGCLAHSYLMTGGDHEVLMRMALQWITFLLVHGQRGEDSWERIDQKVQQAQHPDVYRIRPEGLGGYIRIDRIRAVQEKVALAPSEGTRNCVLIEDAQRLQVESANTLLKMLEEPQGPTVFILLTNNIYQILGTVRSRCQIIRCPSSDPYRMFMRHELYEVTRDMVLQTLLKAYQNQDPSCLFDMSEKIHRDIQAMKKKDVSDQHKRFLVMLCQFLLSWYRDVFVYQRGAHGHVVHQEKMSLIAQFAGFCQDLAMADLLERVHDKIFFVDRNVNVRLFLDCLFLDLLFEAPTEPNNNGARTWRV